MTKKRVKAARKKSAKKKASKSRTTTGSTGSPALRRQLISAIEAIGKFTFRFQKLVRKLAGTAATLDKLDEIKRVIDRSSRKAPKLQADFESALAAAKESGDVPLEQAAGLVEASQFRALLVDFETVLSDQSSDAAAPVSSKDKKAFHERLVSLIDQAEALTTAAEALAADLNPESCKQSHEYCQSLITARDALGKVFTAGLKLVADCRPTDSVTFDRLFRATVKAVEEYEFSLDEVKAEVLRQAERLRDLGGPYRSQQLDEFAKGMLRAIKFDEAIIKHLTQAIKAAVRLPPKAAKLAGRLRSIAAGVLSDIRVELMGASGGEELVGDLPPNAAIRAYDDLTPRDRSFVDIFRELFATRGPAATLGVIEVMKAVNPKLKAQGLRTVGAVTVRTILGTLSSADESVLFASRDDRSKTGGHGGKLLYRLTVPASRKYPLWGEVPADKAPALTTPVAAATS